MGYDYTLTMNFLAGKGKKKKEVGKQEMPVVPRIPDSKTGKCKEGAGPCLTNMSTDCGGIYLAKCGDTKDEIEVFHAVCKKPGGAACADEIRLISNLDGKRFVRTNDSRYHVKSGEWGGQACLTVCMIIDHTVYLQDQYVSPLKPESPRKKSPGK